MMHRPQLCLFALALAAACKGSDADDTGDDTATTGGPGTEPTTTSGQVCPDDPYACCCFEQSEGTVVGRCSLGAVCSTVLADCADASLTSCAPDESHAEAVDCILAALIDGTPGENRWRASFSAGESFSDETVVLYTAGDGSVVWLGARYTGADEAIQGAFRHTVAELDLAGCAALAGVAERWSCLRAAFDATPTETCIAPE